MVYYPTTYTRSGGVGGSDHARIRDVNTRIKDFRGKPLTVQLSLVSFGFGYAMLYG
jgi:hypothetical protein